MCKFVSRTLALAVIPACAAPEPADPPDTDARQLRRIEVVTRDIFSAEESDRRLLYTAANFFHSTTAEHVVERELWHREGDSISPDEVAEIERNLRRFGLFGEVEAQLVDVPESPEQADLHVDTRDRFSLVFGAAVASVGGVQTVSGTIAEGNLFGEGKGADVSFNTAEDERTISAGYRDPQLLGTWHNLDLRVGETEEGAFGRARVDKPFQHLADPWSYGFGTGFGQRDVDYFIDGESVASVPEQSSEFDVYVRRGAGPRHDRSTIGLSAFLRSTEYGRPLGGARAPGDTVEFHLTAPLSLRHNDEFLKVRRLDSIDFVEDLWTGTRAEIRPGVGIRAEDGRSTELQPAVSGDLRGAIVPLEDTFVTAEANGSARTSDDGLRGWRTGVAIHVFQQSLPLQTLALSVTWDEAIERQGLDPQLTLGEDNGLRGYPARQFSGNRRLRLNVEDRFDTTADILSIRLGLAAFFDAGWIGGGPFGGDFDRAVTSAGLGLRIGSSRLFGGGVLRVDMGFPLDTVDGRDFDPSLSIAVGQVFTYFGNASELRREF